MQEENINNEEKEKKRFVLKHETFLKNNRQRIQNPMKSKD
jgi:hypothetical protein